MPDGTDKWVESESSDLNDDELQKILTGKCVKVFKDRAKIVLKPMSSSGEVVEVKEVSVTVKPAHADVTFKIFTPGSSGPEIVSIALKH